MTEPVPSSALFLGPKSENEELFLKLILDVVRDHIYWRRNFHSEDPPAVAPQQAFGAQHRDVYSKLSQEVFRLTGALKNDVPLFSPRYLGHMVSDVMIPGLVGYIAAMLYNPNNVSREVSPVTTELEAEVGRQLAHLTGFGSGEAPGVESWGHITGGGTIANLEAVWVARNLKYHPLAIRNAARALGLDDFLINGCPAASLTPWQGMNVPPDEALTLTERLREALAQRLGLSATAADVDRRLRSVISANSARRLGMLRFTEMFTSEGGLPRTVLVVPRTKHYSWVKAAEVFALGMDQVIEVPVTRYFRQDMAACRRILASLLEDRVSPLISVAVCGSSEAGAVDDIAAIADLRDELAHDGLGYFLHCDAAWGGYARAAFLDPDGHFRACEQMQEAYGRWPSRQIHASFRAMSRVDAVTIDPHKLGYVPYPAGAIVYRDARMREMVTQEAPYALGRASHITEELHLGRYILEGSKPGAAAAAVWLANEVFPLNSLGYGHLIGNCVVAAQEFQRGLGALRALLQDRYEIAVVNQPPDLNIVCYFFNPSGNRSLCRMNRFNDLFFQRLSAHPSSSVHAQDFYVSHTDLRLEDYDHGLLWDLIRANTSVSSAGPEPRSSDVKLSLLRSTIMNPFVRSPTPEGDYIDKFVRALPEILDRVYGEWKSGVALES